MTTPEIATLIQQIDAVLQAQPKLPDEKQCQLREAGTTHIPKQIQMRVHINIDDGAIPKGQTNITHIITCQGVQIL
ncbi:uncharacterized protein KD926_010309 [Aspergillus affinis]|uniref:uncharacterized protein n=1 Tax=Aspergillus affinis TaxID=1070780 RepID=UPI0022FE6831|nr:uncharacterized protein KD926_010309 [Aspergillus affinis]KAI9044986.1 hypothetical protein KD926_010309 [Aspergillus affinis]